ncbi:mismatch repair protein MLH3 LALA0_S01e04082g [Lachancea lanzarotensis]|uniref:LALA0S01e04082g1_1 n=1 Tax=Lachancea lanzarotensis TaxID=1245769 RepID=A0A0C7N0V6_9SACH|nr:uncharacterized protein LALA0_S01e04082g [Lachancea lanzarotensis]CEP60147.1 LALA0S01e04082g1_1 [Lachancea lanzarotensis]
MTGEIRKLSATVADAIAAGKSVKCITTAIGMLLENSVESGASDVEIVVDLDHDAFTVRDNGCGMNAADLEYFGRSGYSSKAEKKGLKWHQGRSIHIISCMAKITTFTRAGGDNSALSKLPMGEIQLCDFPLPFGTSIIVTDFFHNVPVRREVLQATPKSLIYDKLRLLVFDQLVMNPDLQILVTSATLLENGFTIFESRNLGPNVSSDAEKLSSCLHNVFGSCDQNYGMMPVHAQFKSYKLNGLVSTALTSNKGLQLLYINGQRCEDEAVKKPISRLLSNVRSPGSESELHSRRHFFPYVLKFSTSSGIPSDLPRMHLKGHSASSVLQSLITSIVNTGFKIGSWSPRKRTATLSRRDCKRPLTHKLATDGVSEVHFASFRKSVLNTFAVVNQVDRKFILLRATKTIKHDFPLLILVDQHACDERIKLESMLQEFICEFALFPQALFDVNLQITLTLREYQIIEAYRTELSKWGLRYIVEDLDAQSSEIVLIMTTLPKILQHCSKSVLKKLLVWHADDLRLFRKACVGNISDTDNFEWWKYTKCMPSILLDLLRSRACRSAITFGKELSNTECELMVAALRKCRNPFYCAHGRPSIVPITTDRQTAGVSFSSDYTLEAD